MAVSSHSRRDEASDESRAVPVGVYESCPGRLVFIEDGNTDAWIATDHAVDPTR